MNSGSRQSLTALGVGFSNSGSPVEQVRGALSEALKQTGDLPPAIALAVTPDSSKLAAVCEEAQKSLKDCTVIGCAAPPWTLSPVFPRSEEGESETGILLLASAKVNAKVGVGEGEGKRWEALLDEAFEGSYIHSTSRLGYQYGPQAELMEWYLYRRPSLLIAVVLAESNEMGLRRRQTMEYLKEKFRGRIPTMTISLDSEKGGDRIFAGGRILSSGVAFLTVKTDVLHRFDRFHNFEPVGKKYFVTKSQGRRIIEFNNRPALPEYLHFQSDDIPVEKSYEGYFSLYPLAYLGREGRYHLFLPAEVHEDKSISLNAEPLGELPLHPMISVSSAQLGRAGEDGTQGGGREEGETGLEIVLRHNRLRDFRLSPIDTLGDDSGLQHVEFNISDRLVVRLPEGDWEGETSHISVQVRDEIDPLAAVTIHNERLLEEVFSEKSKMEALLDGLAETLYIVDNNHFLQFHRKGDGPAAAALAEEPRERRCYEVIFQRELPCPWCALTETLATRQIVRQTVHLREEDSHFQLTFSPWRDPLTQEDFSICLLVDITAQRRLEEQMVKTKKLSSLSILSAGMAHELNNPLGAINFNLEVLRGREGDPEYREILQSVINDVQRVNRIIGNLLTFSRSGAKSGEVIELGDVLHSSIELLASSLEKARVDTELDLPPDLPRIWGNFQDLQQVFVNLLSNARDAMPAGGVIRIGAGTVSGPHGNGASSRLAVVYEGKANIDLLLDLKLPAEWDVVYLRAGSEALDYFTAAALEPPDVLLLAVSRSPEECGLDELLPVVEEVCSQTKVVPFEGERRDELVETLCSLHDAGEETKPREFVEVRISDTGIGMSGDKLDQIFDPFFTTKDERRGTGLGLSVVHKILENHGADINAESAVGEGSTFRVRFPLAAEPQKAGQQPYFKEKRSLWGRLFS